MAHCAMVHSILIPMLQIFINRAKVVALELSFIGKLCCWTIGVDPVSLYNIGVLKPINQSL